MIDFSSDLFKPRNLVIIAVIGVVMIMLYKMVMQHMNTAAKPSQTTGVP